MFETAQRVGILLVLAVILGYVWHLDGRGRWRERLTARFVYGVPWGSLVSVLLVLAVYLFVQSGIESWYDPAVVPFRSWSYSYPLGMVAAGFAHAGPGHLIGNLLGAVVLSPLVEYAWGHYPPGRHERGSDPGYDHPPPGPSGGARSVVGDRGGGDGTADGLLARPPVRAFVVFPAAIIAISVLTSVFARGWSLGYSGTVFFLLGVAVVLVPLATVVGMVTLSGLSVVVSSLQTPVLEVTADSGVPGPPSWAAINVQAHLLGFLLGVLVAVVILRRRDRKPAVGRLALAVVLVVLVRGLWGFATGGGGTFTRWQGLGVIFVLCLSAVIVALVAVEDQRLVGPVTVRRVVVGGVVLITVLTALTSVPLNHVGMDEDPVPDTGGIDIEDYTVTYAEDTPHGRVAATAGGVIVVSEQRYVWSSVVRVSELAHRGEATATVGGVGWRKVVDIERSGWAVAGNDTVYAVELAAGDRRVDAFQSDPKRAETRVAGYAVTVLATPEEFRLRLTREGESVETPIPAVGDSRPLSLPDASPGSLTVVTEERDGAVRVLVEHDDTRVPVAQKERYD